MTLLEKIHSPADLKPLSLDELKQVAEEIRERMINTVAETGGHLASSLGAVELTIGLHRVFDLPYDQIVWDVGHQTYAHKLLTGRQSRFHTLRQYQGLSGFPKREESEYDCFDTGHSSTSISAALGLARARDLAGKTHRVVAVIGDGSLSNGLALEAMNDAGHQKTDLLVILNDNRMAISRPVGGLSDYLNQIITGKIYNRLKNKVEGILGAIPTVGRSALKLTNYLEEIAKGLIVPGVLFEELGFRYIGPVAGHDLEVLLETLGRVKDFSGPIILHVLTQKGKGFTHAEKDPETFHGTPRFDTCTGKSKSCPAFSYSQAFSQSLVHLAETNEKVVAIVAAMTSGTALDEFARRFPKRFFDVGIAEGHAVTLAAGLAAGGYIPVVAIYSTFFQRAYDQIVHDVCMQKLPVIFAIDRAGLVGEDGPTHHGVFDIAFLRHIPNLAIFAPSQADDLAGMLATAIDLGGPIAIRYPRANLPEGRVAVATPKIPLGKGRLLKSGQDIALLAVGNMVKPALQAAESLQQQGIRAAVWDPRSIKPLDQAGIAKLAKAMGVLLTIEDHVQAGGFGSAVLETLQAQNLHGIQVRTLGYPDEFIPQGSREILHARYELDAAGIEKNVRALLKLAMPTKRGKPKGRTK